MPTDPILDDDGNPLPIVEAPAVVVTPKKETPAEEVRSIVEDEAKHSEQALKTKGQREISDLWEGTQKRIALSVTYVSLTVASLLALAGFVNAIFAQNENSELIAAGISAFVFLSNVANLVIGFYFGRTNHSRVIGAPSETRDS